MKKFLLLIIILSFIKTTYPFFDQIQNYFQKDQKDYCYQTIGSSTIVPHVFVQELVDPIDFKQAMNNLISNTKNNNIQGIILVIDSLGGSSSQFSGLHDLIKKAATLKPVVSFIRSSAQSGGYMLASAADYIIAPSFGEVGSIGVICEIPRYGNATSNNDVMEFELFKAGKYKASFHPHNKKLSPEDRKYINDILASIYAQFLSLVSHNRKLDIAKSSQWAEGKMFVGTQALELGLIDQIGTYFDVENKILELIRARNPKKQFSDSFVPVYPSWS